MCVSITEVKLIKYFSKAEMFVSMLTYVTENLYWQTEGCFACVMRIYVWIFLEDVGQTFEKHVKVVFHSSPLPYLHRKSKSCVLL